MDKVLVANCYSQSCYFAKTAWGKQAPEAQKGALEGHD